MLKFQPISHSIQKPVDFISGTGSIQIPLANFYSSAPESLDPDTILIQATAELNNPAFVSVSNKEAQTGPPNEHPVSDDRFVIAFDIASNF
jgi:hypothetical protein